VVRELRVDFDHEFGNPEVKLIVRCAGSAVTDHISGGSSLSKTAAVG